MRIPDLLTMRLPGWLTSPMLGELLAKVALAREPDFLIGGDADPYLRRWHVTPRGDGPATYLHHFLRSDDDRALHDHPWASTSILLHGSYREHLADGTAPIRTAGEVISRDAESAHRVELLRDPATGKEMPVWTLFLTGPRVREWGFWCEGTRWVPWQEFTKRGAPGETGKGCGE